MRSERERERQGDRTREREREREREHVCVCVCVCVCVYRVEISAAAVCACVVPKHYISGAEEVKYARHQTGSRVCAIATVALVVAAPLAGWLADSLGRALARLPGLRWVGLAGSWRHAARGISIQAVFVESIPGCRQAGQ